MHKGDLVTITNAGAILKPCNNVKTHETMNENMI